MAAADLNLEERQIHQAERPSYADFEHNDEDHEQNAQVVHKIAGQGHLATDRQVYEPQACKNVSNRDPRFGEPLFQFDAAAEARLRWKIDLYIVPTVALLYLLCFIDRSNIGKFCHLGHDMTMR
jgi:hypothetical protein